MSKFVNSPEAPRFPEGSENVEAITDSIILVQATNIILAKFHNSFGYDSSQVQEDYVGASLYSPSRTLRNYLELTRASNPLVITQFIKMVYEMDGINIRDEKQQEWIEERIKLDEVIDTLLQSPQWVDFVDKCDNTHGERYTPQYFSEYHQRRLWRRSQILRNQIESEIEKFMSNLQDNDNKTENSQKLTASSLEKAVQLSLLLGDSDSMLRLLQIHLRTDIFASYSTVENDAVFRQNIESLIVALSHIDPRLLQKLYHEESQEFTSTNNFINDTHIQQHIVLLSAFARGDVDTIHTHLIHSKAEKSYRAYQMNLLGRILSNPSIQISLKKRKLFEEFLVEEIRNIPEKYAASMIGEFFHPDLVQKYIQVLCYHLDSYTYTHSDVHSIWNYVIEHWSDHQKVSIIDFVRLRIKKTLERIESGESQYGSRDKDVMFNNDRLEAALQLAIHTHDRSMLEDIFEIAFDRLGDSTMGAVYSKDILMKIVPLLIKHGHDYYAQRLKDLAIDWYSKLHAIAIATYTTFDFIEREYLVDGLPIMLKIVDEYSQHYPNEAFIWRNGSENIQLTADEITSRATDYLEWIARGLEVSYEHDLLKSRSVTEPLRLAEAILQNTNRKDLILRVKQAILSESLRLFDQYKYSGAYFYIESLFEFISRQGICIEDVLGYLSKDNFAWIVQSLFPDAPLLFRPSLQ